MSEQQNLQIPNSPDDVEPASLVKKDSEFLRVQVAERTDGPGYDIEVVSIVKTCYFDGTKTTTKTKLGVREVNKSDIDEVIVLLKQGVLEDREPTPETTRIAEERPDLVRIVQQAIAQGIETNITQSFLRQETHSKVNERRQIWLSVVLTAVSLILGWLLSLIGTPGTVVHLFQH